MCYNRPFEDDGFQVAVVAPLYIYARWFFPGSMGINSGLQKWEAKVDTDAAAQRYKENVNLSEYQQGIVDAADGELSASQVENSQMYRGYRDFVQNRLNQAAANFRANTRGKGQKWKRNWLKAAGGNG